MENNYPANWEQIVLGVAAKSKFWSLRQDYGFHIDFDGWLCPTDKEDDTEVHTSLTFTRNGVKGIASITLLLLEERFAGTNEPICRGRSIELTWPQAIAILAEW